MNRMQIAIVAGLALCGSVGTPRARAHETGQDVDVNLVGISTQFFKGTYGATGETSSSGALLAEGEMGGSYLAYGSINEKAGFALDSLCSSASGSFNESDDPAKVRDAVLTRQRPAHYWSAEFKVLPSEIGRVAIEVTWEHWSLVGTGTPVKVGGDTRRIQMSEGERSVIDSVVIVPAAAEYCASTIAIAVTAKTHENERLGYEQLAYDAWFEHVDKNGRFTRRHAATIGRQGEEVSLRFAPVRLPLAGRRFDDGTTAEAVLEMSGSVLGRLRADGSITVRLGAGRWTGLTRADMPRRGGIGDGGTKIFVVSPGETVRLTLPVPTGKTGAYASTDATGDAAGPFDPTHLIQVDNPTFYAGSQDSILLTVDRVR